MNTINYIIHRDKTEQSPFVANYRKYTGTLTTAANKKEILDPPKSQYFMHDGTIQTYDIDNLLGWTTDPWEIGQKVVVVGHFEPTRTAFWQAGRGDEARCLYQDTPPCIDLY